MHGWHIYCIEMDSVSFGSSQDSLQMNAFPVPFKVIATVLVTSLLVAIGIFNLRDRASWVEAADGAFWVETRAGLVAEEVESDGPAVEAGIRPGDLLVSVNGQETANLGEYFRLIDNLGVNATATYRISTGTQSRDVPVTLAGRGMISAKDFPRTLLAFLYLGIGLFVAIRGGRQPRAYHFYLICLSAFVVYLYSYTTRFSTLDWIVYILSVSALLLLPALFVHFCMRFPKELDGGRSRAPLVYIPMVGLGLLEVLWMTGRLAAFRLPRDARTLQLLDRIHLIYLVLGFLIGGSILLYRGIKARDLTTRQQMKWVSYGTLAGVVPFSLIYVVPELLGLSTNLAVYSSLFLGLIPLSFAYAIIRYRLLDVELIARRGAAYFLASSLLLVVYLLFVLALGEGIKWVAPEADFLVIAIAALTIALLFAPLRSRIQRRLDRFFYKDQFDERASLMEFARTLSAEISLSRLSRSILERVTRTFRLDKAVLFFADASHPGFFRITDSLGVTLPALGKSFYREEELLEGRGPAADGPDQSSRLQQAHSDLARLGVIHLQELMLRGRRMGFIGLGSMPADRHFSTEDLDLLSALSNYAAIALENAYLYRSVETKAMELERLKVYTENIIESVNVAVLALDSAGRVTSCNRAFEDLYRIRRDEIAGTPIDGLLPADVIASIHRVTGTKGWALKSPANIYKLYLGDRRGRRLIVDLSVIPLRGSFESDSGCLLVMDDITEKVQLADQLLQAEKLSSLGLLAAGIAHEVNTPITGISSYTQMLLKETPASDERKGILEKIEKQTFRAAGIVNGLLNFARMNGTEYQDLDVNRLLQDSLSLLEHQFTRGGIRISRSLDSTIPSVFGSSGKLQQVFVNLFLNARDAMPAGGELRVHTSMNESMVIVDIEDTGVGISEEDIKRIYDPFFTTKGTARGTGLGLAISYGIIQEHGGRILVDSEPGKGTRFRLKLPTRQLPSR
jgi:two-component system NtrC family sensor kinase